MPVSRLSRRSFLKSTAATAAGLTTFGVPAVNVLGANEKLNIGVIGAGGRGMSVAKHAMDLGQNIVALCDVARFRLDKASEIVTKANQPKPALYYGDHGQLLDHKGLDAVIIATPDHWHHDILVDTMKAGKDAYAEKPLSKTIEEGKSMVAAVRATKCIVQVGNQRHSGEHWKRCRDYIQSSDFGKLVWVKVWDCRTWVKKDPYLAPPDAAEKIKGIDWKRFQGKAPPREFDPHRYWAWRWYWDYAGGLLTDIGAHQIDIVQWLSGHDKGPKSVVANGGNHFFDFWETPDVVHGVWDYGDFTATFDVQFVNGFDGVGAAFYGSKQTLVADAEKEIRLYDTIEQPKPDQKPIAAWKAAYEGKEHMQNWLECCRSRKQPNSTIEVGHRVITSCHLANMAYRQGKKIYYDPEREEVVAANK